MKTISHFKTTTELKDSIALCCPVCDGGYNHIKRVGTELDPTGDETEIYPGTSLVFERRSGERRSALRIEIEGECGHSWKLILQQHKGIISITLESINLTTTARRLSEAKT
jgi:hypothetical protein